MKKRTFERIIKKGALVSTFFVSVIIALVFLVSQNVNASNSTNVLFPELEGKKVSILGDSLMAYIGTTSNGGQDESKTTYPAVWSVNAGIYPSEISGVSKFSDTFYGKLIEENNMELLVNNSIAGTGIINNYTDKAPYLDDITYLGGTDESNRVKGLWDYDENGNRVDPDIIILSASGNDFYFADLGKWDGNIEALDEKSIPTTYKEAYAVMLKRLTIEYPNAEIWCLTLHSNAFMSYIDWISPSYLYPAKNEYGNSILDHNQAIREVAEVFGAKVIDLEYSMTPEQHLTHKYDHVHPNLAGHMAMYEQMVKDVSKMYTMQSELVSLEITSVPDKEIYMVGESFDPTGMVIKASYKDLSVNENFTDYTITPSRPLEVGDEFVTITSNSGNISVNQPINVVADVPSTGTPPGIVFDKELTDGGYLPAGNYILKGDVNLTDDLVLLEGEYNIFLNGYTLKGTGKSSVIGILSGVVLNIYDVKDNSGVITGGVGLYSEGMVYGGGIISIGGVINMHGGTISGNSAEFGGGIFTTSPNTLNVYGGIIENNTASYNGGGLASIGNINVSGATIRNNKTDGSGGGVFARNGDIVIENSIITQNSAKSGGGVFIEYKGHDVVIGSDVTIINNTLNAEAGGVVNNIHLIDGNLAVKKDGALNTNVGISTQTKPTSDSTVTIVKGETNALTNEDLAYFVSDISDYAAVISGSDIVLSKSTDFPIEYEGVVFDKKITDGGYLEAGNYVLMSDVNLTDDLVLLEGEYNIFLNGYTLKGTGKSSVIGILSGVVLNIYDVKDNSGVITGGVGLYSEGMVYGGGIISIGGVINMHGGTISGNSAEFGGGIFTTSPNTLNVYGGIIENNTASYNGGGLASIGNINVSGATIRNNKTDGSGGGVFARNGDIVIENSIITQNSAKSGGGVFIEYKGHDVVIGSDVTIINNTLNAEAGGVVNNIHLIDGNLAVKKDGALNTNVGISTQTKPTSDSTVTIVKGETNALTNEDLAYFVSDISDYRTEIINGAINITK